MIVALRQIAKGHKMLREWRVDGCVPVPIEQAQARANVCLHGGPNGGKCPMNEPDDNWALGKFKALYVARSLELRTLMNIHLEGEKELNTCGACGCVLKLKVHSPREHLIRNTPPEEFNRYTDFCWMRTENNKPTT